MDEFLTATVRGLTQGSVYVMLGLGFVIVFRATKVINLAMPAIMIFGATITSMTVIGAGVPFFLALGFGTAAAALLGMVIERTVMRPMVGEPPFSATMVTVGVLILMTQIVNKMIGVNDRQIGLPFSDRSGQFNFGGTLAGETVDGLPIYDGGVTVFHREIFQLTVVAIVVVGLMAYLRRSRNGIAMRATALDQETALAQGVPVGRMFSLSWLMAGGLASLAGLFVASGAQGSFGRNTALLALKALPAIIVGGLDSIGGAVVGGFAVGLVEAYTKIYQPEWLGANFDQVAPYVLMMLVLLVRPYGIFGTPEVERV
ncbi:MAG: branched-chain amino acid transport system permease protein [Glaciecola sp.]